MKQPKQLLYHVLPDEDIHYHNQGAYHICIGLVFLTLMKCDATKAIIALCLNLFDITGFKKEWSRKTFAPYNKWNSTKSDNNGSLLGKGFWS